MQSLGFVVAMYLAAAIHRYLQTYAPSNLLVAYARRTRPRLCVVGTLLALAAALMLGALVLSERAASGGPGWLHLLALTAIWDGLKFAALALAVLLRCATATLRRVTARTRPTMHGVRGTWWFRLGELQRAEVSECGQSRLLLVCEESRWIQWRSDYRGGGPNGEGGAGTRER